MESPFENYNQILNSIKDIRCIEKLGTKAKTDMTESINKDILTNNIQIIDTDKITQTFNKMYIVFCATLVEEMLKDYFFYYIEKKKINLILQKEYKYKELIFPLDCLETSHKTIKSNWKLFIKKKINKKNEELKESYSKACSKFHDRRYLLYTYGLRNIIVHNNGIMNEYTYNNYKICKEGIEPTIENGFIDLLRTYLINFNRFLNDTFS